MQHLKDPKNLNNFLKALKTMDDGSDHFLKDQFTQTLGLFEKLNEAEKKVDRVLSKKRTDIQENFTYSDSSVQTCLRVYITSEIITEENNNRKLKLGVMGKLLSNLTIDNTVKGPEQDIFKKTCFLDLLKSISLESHAFESIKTSFSDYRKKALKTEMKERHGFICNKAIYNSTELPFSVSLKLNFNSFAKFFKLSSRGVSLMGKIYATRKEVISTLKRYIDKKKLLKNDTIILDQRLNELLSIKDSNTECLPLSDLGAYARSLFKEELDYTVKFDITNPEKQVRAFDLLIDVELNEFKECMVFYVQKLLFDEKDRQRSADEYNNLIQSHTETKLFEKQVLQSFEKLYKNLLKRRNFIEFHDNIPAFLKNFISKQRKLASVIKDNSNSLLRKRNWNDENDFTESLIKNYEDVLEDEIQGFLDEKLKSKE